MIAIAVPLFFDCRLGVRVFKSTPEREVLFCSLFVLVGGVHALVFARFEVCRTLLAARCSFRVLILARANCR
jgi:hypothetical protein